MIAVRYRKLRVGSEWFSIPTNVSRVTSEKFNGWQVRFKAAPEHNAFFSDSKYGGVQPAFDAATAHAEKHRPVYDCKCKPDAGVTLVDRVTPEGIRFHFVVHGVHRKQAPVHIRVGVLGKFRRKDFDAAERKALKLRQKRVADRAREIQLARRA